jgi:copper(I)-binding protein
MTSILKPLSLRACATGALAALSLMTMPLMAHEYSLGDVQVLHPYAPPTPPGVGMAAGYLEIINHGDVDDRLIGGKVVFAADVQIHQTVLEDDVSRMRQLEAGLVIPAGATVKIEPMGIHLMFAGLTQPLREGDSQSATLIFEKAGEMNVEFIIEHPASGAMESMHMDGMNMDGMKMDGMKMDGMNTEGMKQP